MCLKTSSSVPRGLPFQDIIYSVLHDKAPNARGVTLIVYCIKDVTTYLNNENISLREF